MKNIPWDTVGRLAIFGAIGGAVAGALFFLGLTAVLNTAFSTHRADIAEIGAATGGADGAIVMALLGIALSTTFPRRQTKKYDRRMRINAADDGGDDF